MGRSRATKRAQEDRENYTGREDLRVFYDHYEFPNTLRHYVDGQFADRGGCLVLDYGFLNWEIDPDRWAGPFPGGHCTFTLRDNRGYAGSLPDVEPNPDQCMGTQSHPFVIRMFGNDDTSYSNFYRTEEEARLVVEELRDGHPLRFDLDVLGRGFEFTN